MDLQQFLDDYEASELKPEAVAQFLRDLEPELMANGFVSQFRIKSPKLSKALGVFVLSSLKSGISEIEYDSKRVLRLGVSHIPGSDDFNYDNCFIAVDVKGDYF